MILKRNKLKENNEKIKLTGSKVTALLFFVGLNIFLACKNYEGYKADIKKAYNEYKLKNNNSNLDLSHIKDFDTAFAQARESSYDGFLRRNKHGNLSDYHTKYIEEIEPRVYTHVTNFNAWAEEFLTRDPVLRKFSQVTYLTKDTLKDIIASRFDLSIKERIAQTTMPKYPGIGKNNTRLGVYRPHSGELYAEYGDYSTYAHEKIHSIDFGILQKGKKNIVLSQELSPLLKDMVDLEILTKASKHYCVSSEGQSKFIDGKLEYQLSNSELFARILSIPRILELTYNKKILMNGNSPISYEHITQIPFSQDIQEILPALKKDKLMMFINALYGKENLYKQFLEEKTTLESDLVD